MVTIYIIVEGQSEEQVIKNTIAPELAYQNIYLTPILLSTSKGHKGGDVSFDRLKRHVRNLINQQDSCYVSTFLDLYQLKTDFPNFQLAQQKNDLYEKVNFLEKSLHEEIINQLNCRPERFIPHIQPHELEALFFTDPSIFNKVESQWQVYQDELESIKNMFENPEYINNSYETAPSKRLERLLTPKYRKTRHAPLIAQKTTLAKMEQSCPHFREWLSAIRHARNLAT